MSFKVRSDLYKLPRLRLEFIKENKKVRKQEKKELDQESDQVKKKKRKRSRKRMIERKNNNFYFEPVQHLKMFNTSKCSKCFKYSTGLECFKTLIIFSLNHT